MRACRRCRCSTNTASPKRNQNGKLVTISASKWLDQNRAVEQMTWCPGRAEADPETGWWWTAAGSSGRASRASISTARRASSWAMPRRPRRGSTTCARVFTRTMPTISSTGWRTACSARARRSTTRWCWAASRASARTRCLSRSSTPSGRGISTRSRRANCSGDFNGFVKSVILRVNEARDLGEVNRFDFYDHTKIYTAAPPDVLRVDEKNLREYYVFNVSRLDHHHQPQDRRHLSAGRRPPPLRRVVRLHTKEEFSPRILAAALGLVATGGYRARRGLSHRARPLRLRPEGAAAEDRGVLGDRGGQPRTGERCALRRNRGAGRTRRDHHRAAGRHERRAGLDDRAENTSGSCRHRLKDSGYSVFRKPQDQERAVAVRRSPGAALRQGQFARRRTAESRSEF